MSEQFSMVSTRNNVQYNVESTSNHLPVRHVVTEEELWKNMYFMCKRLFLIIELGIAQFMNG